ncbi:hypothetical protein SAMN02910358_01424 [Lachnospiraceae bacterium XBB1006]|nr:hypothetical protein SAMN02910358_01424 [Lachnospiraceae bacterium XBB1006]
MTLKLIRPTQAYATQVMAHKVRPHFFVGKMWSFCAEHLAKLAQRALVRLVRGRHQNKEEKAMEQMTGKLFYDMYPVLDGQDVTVTGWVKTKRIGKAVAFLEISDGTTLSKAFAKA